MASPTYVVPRGIAAVTLRLLQGQDLEGGQGGGARLRGDHAAEPRHRPRPDVVVIRTDCGEGTAVVKRSSQGNSKLPVRTF